jgi:hypothetical protein
LSDNWGDRFAATGARRSRIDEGNGQIVRLVNGTADARR